MTRTTRGILVMTITAFLACGVATAEDRAAKTDHLTGTIVSVNDREIVVRTSDDTERTFNLKDDFNMPANFRVGDRIDVTFEDGWLSDTVVSIHQAGSGTTAATRPSDASVMPSDSPSAGMRPHEGMERPSDGSTADNRYGEDRYGMDVPTDADRGNDPLTDTDNDYDTSARTYSASTSGTKLSGKIVSVNDEQIVLMTDAGERKVLIRDTGFEFPGDLREGSTVDVVYFDRNGQLVATNVVNTWDSDTESDTYAAEGRLGENERLPQTASFLPLFGLGGLLAVGAAALVRRARKS
jgi:hypothetical protein